MRSHIALSGLAGIQNRGMSARLATSVLVGGLMRKAQSEGGFAAVLAKGDSTAGAVIVILHERGGRRGCSSAYCSPTGPIDGTTRPAKSLTELRKMKTFQRSSRAGGASTRICGWSNWISRPQNGSPLK